MDFWSRLIAGTSLSPASNKASANNPDKRLTRFKREYNQLLQIWRGSSNLSQDNDAANTAQINIQELTSVLSDEARRPSPHVCVSFAATKQMYLAIGKIATTSYNEPIIREAIAFFGTLIESEEEDFLENSAFSQSLMNLLVRITGANSIRLGSETEVEVVELAFGIAAKIRLQPEILPAWFRETHEVRSSSVGAHEKFAGRTHKEDFPLFYLLIDYIHHEGRIGDFARTGLLYIIESASTSAGLEQWIVESDLATLMATGLGALYSQLSRKLVIDYPFEELPSILALSDYEHPTSTSEIVSSASLDFQGHIETFLSHLVFWQDVLEHCKSVEVKQTLLEHFQVIFLQQLLYPSLLESSDIDGGSSVAVLTYLRRILEALDHPDMIHMILHYLLALPDISPIRTSGSRASVSAARKRKSMDLQTMMASQPEMSTPTLFNLVDLILGCLKSPNQQTIGVTLQLLTVILRRHHRYAITTLLKTGKAPVESSSRTIGIHQREMGFLMGLLDDAGLDGNLEEAYENHVKDAMALLECHPCSQPLIAPKSSDGATKSHVPVSSIPGAPRDVTIHTLRPDDPILKSLLNVLDGFFLNPVETNLSLTETIVDLAACGYMDISGWFLPDPSRYVFDSDDEDEESGPAMTVSTLLPKASTTAAKPDSILDSIRRAQRHPKFPPDKTPQILLVLQKLSHQASVYRAQIPRFSDLLAQRKHALSAEPAVPRPLPIRNELTRGSDDGRSDRSSSPANKQSAFDSLAQRIFPDLTTPLRSATPGAGSPRGRRSQDGNARSGTATPSKSGRPPLQSESSTSSRLSPAVGAMQTPSRAFSLSPLTVDADFDKIQESQSRALEGVDRSILSRKVTMPKENVSVFANLYQPPPSETPEEPTQKATSIQRHLEEDGETLTKVDSINDDTQSEEDNDKDLIGADDDEEAEEEEEKTVSVSHVLTNTIVLQEFLLELVALVQVRAGLFGEVNFV